MTARGYRARQEIAPAAGSSAPAGAAPSTRTAEHRTPSSELGRLAANERTFVSLETASYSGATLLSFLLAAHPEIGSVGEMDGLVPSEDPDTYRCSCGRLIEECPFWNAVRERLESRGIPFDVRRFGTRFDLPGPRWLRYARAGALRSGRLHAVRDAIVQSLPWERAAWRSLTARNEAFIDAVLDVTGKRVFVDSSKDALRLAAMRRLSQRPVAAIHLVRDPRGVVTSRLRRGVPVTPRAAARQWLHLNRRIAWSLEALAPERVTRVRYEDLVADPAGTLARIDTFLGVEPRPATASVERELQHIVGNEMRLRPDTAIAPDERWRSFLTPEQRREIERVAAPLLETYGYR